MSLSAATPLRLIHALPYVDDQASGLSYSVPRLCEALAGRGHALDLFSLTQGDVRPARNVRRRAFDEAPSFGGVGMSEPFRAAITEQAADADVIHAHSLWRMPNVYAGWASERRRKPLVVSPRGTLSPVALSRSAARKRWFWRLLQGPAVRRARLLHATSDQEYRDLRSFGLSQPVAVIPNGVDIPQPPAVEPPGRRRAVYVGRLHAIKGLEELLLAWQALELRHPDWDLRLVGPDEGGHGKVLQQRAAALRLAHVEFAGPRFGAEKLAEYAAADLFVLPSRSENFCMSVAEALAMARPVVTTTATPWSGLRKAGAGWCVDPRSAALGEALSEAMALGRPALAAMGRRGRAWMIRDFSWEAVGRDMELAYRWLVEGGAPPPFVRLD